MTFFLLLFFIIAMLFLGFAMYQRNKLHKKQKNYKKEIEERINNVKDYE